MLGMTSVAANRADQERKAPGRPRSAQVDEAIIEAVLDLLTEGTTAEAMSIEAVATKAGVGKAAIYRRWANKESLLVDAITTIKGGLPEIAGKSVRDDLYSLMRPIGHQEANRAGKIMPCLISVMQRSPELHRGFQKIIAPRRELMRSVLRRGIATGELRPDLDVEVVMVMLSGPLIMQALFNWSPDLPPRAELADRMLTAIWPAIAADGKSATAAGQEAAVGPRHG
jgi:AcrR family transcriptional regulator